MRVAKSNSRAAVRREGLRTPARTYELSQFFQVFTADAAASLH